MDTLARMRQLIGTTAEWTANNLVLGLGEIGVEVVTAGDNRLKIGDGTLPFLSLPYASVSQAAIDALATALSNETNARVAGDAALSDSSDLARAELLTEPAVSELASLWSTQISGEPEDRPGVAASDVVDTMDGRAIQVTGAAVRAARAAYRMFPGHLYEVVGFARRQTNPTDPAGDAVALKAAWLNSVKGQLSAATLEQKTLGSGDGLWGFRKVISLAAGDGVDVVAPAGTIYFTPYVETFGGNGVTNILPFVRVTDLTSNTLISADVTALNARVTALESIDAGDRLTALESITGSPNTAWFNTQADAQAAHIGATVQRIMVFGSGFDPNIGAQYKRVASGEDFSSADGAKWAIEFAQMPVISKNVTYTIGPTGQFPEPGAFTAWLDRRRIAVGVLVTASIAAGTYNCTKQITGHIDGIRLAWTCPAMPGGALAPADFTPLDATFHSGLDSFAGMSPSALSTASAANLAHLKTRYAVVLQFDGTFNIAVALNNRHSGDWSNCQCLFANVLADGTTPGTCQTGVTTGDAEIGGVENGCGPGGVGLFSLSSFHGFTETCVIANYGGVIDIKQGAATFGGFACVYSQFGGVVRGPNAFMVGGKNYGWRNNHGGWGYLPAAFLHGNNAGAEATNTPSMYWMHQADVQYNYVGVQTTFGGSGKIALGICKNNARYQVTIPSLDGNIDCQAVDMATTATFPDTSTSGGGAIGPPIGGIYGVVGGGVMFNNFGTSLGNCTGHQTDIYCIGKFSVFMGNVTYSTFGTAKTFGNRPIGIDPTSGIIAADTPRNGYANVEMSGTNLVIPLNAPRVIGIVQPVGAAGTPITINTIDVTNWAPGDQITFVAPRTGTGETVLINESAGGAGVVCLASPSRWLVNAVDTLTLVRPTTTVSVSEVSFARNYYNASSQKKRLRTVNVAGPAAATRDDDIVIINKPGAGETTALALDANMNYAGSQLTVKDGKGNGASFAITITPAGGQQIDGSASYAVNTNRGFVTIACDGAGWNVIGKG